MPRNMLVLTEGHSNPITAKTATSVIRYRPEEIVAVLDSTQAGKTCQDLLGVGGNIPVVASVADAPKADTLLVGIAPSGGRIPDAWRKIILTAIERGMNIVSGLHDFIGDDPQFAAAAKQRGVTIQDVRKNNERDVALRLNIRPECLRIHTVGQDCSTGKMVVAIEVARGVAARGLSSKFVATGQTGIMIEGDGCPIDCVVSDFVNGAAEKLVLANQHHDAIFIEGQGTIVHPKYSAVTLGLLHGSQPQGLILCYEVGRKTLSYMDHVPVTPMAELLRIYETMGSLMHPCRVIGVGMNTRKVSATEAAVERKRISRELGVPACDVLRDGPGDLVDAVLAYRKVVIG